jgi:hypothetical protein
VAHDLLSLIWKYGGKLPPMHSTFREKLEWLEEAETFSLRVRASCESHSTDEPPPSRSGSQGSKIGRS